MKKIFITGATGYMGKRLIKKLLQKGHRVSALVRKGSEHKVPAGAGIIVADPFNASSFVSFIPEEAVFVQLLGVAHPSPQKAKQFREIDLRSVQASADAAGDAGVSHFIYVSVSMTPSALMRAYQEVRKEGEEYCKSRKLNCTFIRPWYVLGPGHWWPLLLLPVYAIAYLIPAWREKAKGTALVTISQMVATLVKATEASPVPCRIIEIKDIRRKTI